MRLQLLVVMVGIALIATSPTRAGSKTKVIGTAHDVGGNGCKSCHAPHNGSVATGGTDQASGRILDWDRNFSSVTFGVYDSPTMNSKATESGGLPLNNTENRMFSLLCMSCHDGVSTPTVIGATSVSAVGNVANSAGLTNDHPINMAHDPTKDAGLATTANVSSGGLVLYGATNTVQCGSCHDVHDNTNTRFLRKSNTGSALCTTCHI